MQLRHASVAVTDLLFWRMTDVEGIVLVLARCKRSLSWRTAFFSVSGKVLRIVARGVEKWRATIGEAHVISALRAMPAPRPSKLERIEEDGYVPNDFMTFEVWHTDAITNPNATPVLKFAGGDKHDIERLHAALVSCAFQPPACHFDRLSLPTGCAL